MKDNTLIRCAAILSITILEVVNLLTVQYDGALLLLVGLLIGTLAGMTINLLKSPIWT